MRGRIEAGKSGGGNAYGYQVVHALGADGQLIRGDRKIDSGQATVVRRIFKGYADGLSPRAIALRSIRRACLGRQAKPGDRRPSTVTDSAAPGS